jgi:hypothetical protein
MYGMRRKLRIVFSAMCGITCLLLVVLWVRRYWWWDTVGWGITAKQGFIVRSVKGAAVLEYLDFSGTEIDAVLFQWRVESTPLPDSNQYPFGGVENTFAGFLIWLRRWGENPFLLCVPYWFLVPLTAGLAVALWGKWALRFSLKTLLIATTLLAVVLGSISYAVK